MLINDYRKQLNESFKYLDTISFDFFLPKDGQIVATDQIREKIIKFTEDNRLKDVLKWIPYEEFHYYLLRRYPKLTGHMYETTEYSGYVKDIMKGYIYTVL